MDGPEEEAKEAAEKATSTAEPPPGKNDEVEPSNSNSKNDGAEPAGRRPRGRPRKHPPPIISGNVAPVQHDADPAHPEGVMGTVAVASYESRVESALLMHRMGGPPEPEGAGPAAIKRPRGRPRKHPLQGTVTIAPGPGAPPAASLGGTAILTQASGSVGPAPPATTGQAAVILKRPRGRPRKHPLPDAGGISGGVSVPQTDTGRPGLIGEKQVAGILADSSRTAPAEGRPRGRRQKVEPSILNPFCPECGTYLRMFRPPRGRWRKVCPRCEPERMIVKRDYRDYIDKTGMPCKDRGKCRPERCVKALDCEEMGRYR